MVLMLDSLARNLENPSWQMQELNDIKFSTYRPHVHFRIEQGPYVVQTVTSGRELHKILELRHHSFVEDFLPGQTTDYVDTDQYDMIADHVVVKLKETDQIIGTYRIICSKFSKRFFCSEQYNIDKFLSTADGTKIELGRACIDKNHRNGFTLNLVWKGLARYAHEVGARYMFGCASVKTVSTELAHSMYWHLHPSAYNADFKVDVLPKFHCPMSDNLDTWPSWTEVQAQIPPLLNSYLQAGAWICSEPALDMFFRCVDFFTVLDLTKINPRYERRYFKKEDSNEITS